MTKLTYNQQAVIALLKYDNLACYAINKLADHYGIATDRIKTTSHPDHRFSQNTPLLPPTVLE